MEYDIVIIGSGVAGLTSALYSARGNKSVLIIENGILGGTTATLDIIENYPGFQRINGIELIQKMTEQVMNYGVNIVFENINHIDFDKKCIELNEKNISYKALIIASGTSFKKLNLPNEEEFKFKGLSYCAVCDGSLYKNKKVVVVTNGYSGTSSIEYLKNLTNDLLVLDISDKYKNNDIKVFSNVTINNLMGDDILTGMDITIDKKKQIINIDGLFVALGKETDLSLYKDKVTIKNNFIVSDENMHTNIEGVFVSGDVRYKNLRQIVTACADGAIAGTEAIKYLNTKKSAT